MFLILVFLSSVLGSCFALFCLRCLSRLVVCVYARVYPRYLWRMQLSAIVLFVFSFFVFRFFFLTRFATRPPRSVLGGMRADCRLHYAASVHDLVQQALPRHLCDSAVESRAAAAKYYGVDASFFFQLAAPVCSRALCVDCAFCWWDSRTCTHTLHSATVLSAVQGL